MAQAENWRWRTRKASLAAKFGSERQRWLQDNIRTLSLFDRQSHCSSNQADDIRCPSATFSQPPTGDSSRGHAFAFSSAATQYQARLKHCLHSSVPQSSQHYDSALEQQRIRPPCEPRGVSAAENIPFFGSDPTGRRDCTRSGLW